MLLISVKQQQQQQFISTTAATTTTTIYFIFTSKESLTTSLKNSISNFLFNESPRKLRKTQLVLILIDVISQLVAGINSTFIFLNGRDHGDQSRYSFTHRFGCTHCRHG